MVGRPQAVLDGGVAVANAQADEVVEIAVGQRDGAGLYRHDTNHAPPFGLIPNDS